MFNLNLRPGHTTAADVTLAEAGVLGFQVQLFAGHTDAANVILRSGIFYAVADAPAEEPSEDISGTSENSQSIATSSADGLITVSGSSAVSQSANTSQSSGIITVTGTGDGTQNGSTSSSIGTITVSGTSSQSQSKATSQASGETEISGVSGTSDGVQSIHTSYSEGHVQNGIIETGSPGGWVWSKHRWPDVSGVASSRTNRNRSSASGSISIASKSNSIAASSKSEAAGFIVDDIADISLLLSLAE